MQFLGMLMPVLGLVAFAAYVWLLVVAFKESALWGVLVLLFSPITAIIFAVKYWDRAKKPFLVYCGSGAASLAIVFMMFAMVGGQMMQMAAEVQEQMDEELARNQQAAEPADAPASNPDPVTADGYQPVGTDDATDTLAATGEDVASDETVAEAAQETATETTTVSTARRSRRGDSISLSNIESYVGERMRVVTTDGSDFIGRYQGRQDDQLEFEKTVRAGSFAVFISSHEIESLEKYKAR